jgi:hypothetical protein
MSNAFIASLIDHIFQNANIANLGDATGLRGSTVAGNLYLALHTANPGKAGDQTTSEATYTGYARMAIARSAGGFTRTGSVQVSNAALITFAQCTAGNNVITHWSLGYAASGASVIVASGSIGNSYQGPFTATTADVITIPGHSLAVNDQVAFYAAQGSTLPTGITEGLAYFVKTVSGNDITISTTQGGATLDVTAAGDGHAFKVTSLTVSANVTPEFAIGSLIGVFD